MDGGAPGGFPSCRPVHAAFAALSTGDLMAGATAAGSRSDASASVPPRGLPSPVAPPKRAAGGRKSIGAAASA
eukprot:scaffold5607_cov90-Isochrysis_galbana.AAC.1